MGLVKSRGDLRPAGPNSHILPAKMGESSNTPLHGGPMFHR